jgi:hypothetical protein
MLGVCVCGYYIKKLSGGRMIDTWYMRLFVSVVLTIAVMWLVLVWLHWE